MKLFAVTRKAALVLDGRRYAERDQPISKYAHMPIHERDARPYAPAVFTARSNAEKLIDNLPAAVRINYKITEFDSGYVDYPEPR